MESAARRVNGQSGPAAMGRGPRPVRQVAHLSATLKRSGVEVPIYQSGAFTRPEGIE